MKHILAAIACLLAYILIWAVFGLVSAILVRVLWNAVIPQIFGMPELTYWNAYALALLCSCLFKSASTSSKD